MTRLQDGDQPRPGLWEGEDRFRLLLGELQVGVLLQSATAEILSSNPRALELLGLSEDQLLGRTSFHPDWNVIHEDGTPYPGPTHPVPLAIAARQPVRDAVMGVYRPATQDRVWLLVSALPELAGDGSVRLVLCTFTDITGRKLEEQRLNQSEHLLRTTQRLARLGGWEWDPSTRAISWTEEFGEFHDLGPGVGPADFEALLDLSLPCFAPGDRPGVLAAFRHCVEQGEPYDLELPFTTPKGRQLWVRTVGEATQAEGRVMKVAGNLIDITEQVRREEAARRIAAQRHQIQKMESLALLAGGVAHDINNVLGSILAVATLHRRKSEEGSALRQGMETISEACLRGGALAESLRGFARRDLSAVGLLDLNSLIREELLHLRPGVPPTIRVQEELDDHLPAMKGDSAALSHAITSLCANAIQAMPAGGTLWIRSRGEGSQAILLEVEDSGIGMAPEALRQALAPFYTTRLSSKGSGLGLSIVYGTVRAHGGTIDLQSEPGKGTLVRLRLPVPGPAETPDPQAAVDAGTGAGPAAPPRR